MRIAKQKQLQAAQNTQNIRIEGLKMANNKQLYITSTTFFFSCCPVQVLLFRRTTKDTIVKKRQYKTQHNFARVFF